ncbi:MAG: hypothetical protein ACO3YQ_05390, partial [Flavobacteriales bacterium]
MALLLLFLGNLISQAPLSNYSSFQQTIAGYSSTGAGGWSAPANQVILGGGFQHLAGGTVLANFPAQPSGVYPHYTYGPSEYGWNVYNGGTSGSITIHGLHADLPAGYGILKQTI